MSYPFLSLLLAVQLNTVVLIPMKFQECYCSDRYHCNEDEDVMRQASSLANAISGTLAVVCAATAVIVVI